MQILNAKLEIALGLRAMDEGTPPSDAFWCTAFNLGVREYGTPQEIISFDPSLYEDMEGGLLRGDPAMVIKRGWLCDMQTLLRAQVQPIKY